MNILLPWFAVSQRVPRVKPSVPLVTRADRNTRNSHRFNDRNGISDKQFTSEMNNVHPTTRNTPVRSAYSTLFSTDTYGITEP